MLFLLSSCKQNNSSLSLLLSTTVVGQDLQALKYDNRFYTKNGLKGQNLLSLHDLHCVIVPYVIVLFTFNIGHYPLVKK